MSLELIWAGILGFVIIMYVVLDGFDLGIGILFPFIKEEEYRDGMMNTVAPVWDGNETWLVLGGALLYGAFPLAYSTLLPLLYLPLIFMLCALIFRGIAFEFRFKAHSSKKVWDYSFILGSILTAFLQGVILGTFVQIPTTLGTSPTSLSLVWLTPFTLTTGLAVVCGYALLGATWLIGKTEGSLQDKMFKIARYLLIGLVVFLGIVSLWTPFISSAIMQRWFSTPNIFYLAILPLLSLITINYAFRVLKKRHEHGAFMASIAIFIFSYTGFIISIWPYIVPGRYTIWQAAASHSSLVFLLVGACILLPTLIVYNIFQYRVFKGKVNHESGYHE